MKSKKDIKRLLLIIFIGTVFCSQFIGLTICNNMGIFEKQTMGCIMLTSIALTTLFCTEYILIRFLYYKLSGKEAERIADDEFYDLFVIDE